MAQFPQRPGPNLKAPIAAGLGDSLIEHLRFLNLPSKLVQLRRQFCVAAYKELASIVGFIRQWLLRPYVATVQNLFQI